MTVLSPLMLIGLGLASVPIIIHLLNRRRFVRVDWAPMKYLKLTLKTNRRRLRLEQWLLLAVRTLAIVMLFLALARPVDSGSGLASLLVSRGRTTRVIVIDDSLSMGYQTAGRSAMDRAKKAAAELVEQIGTQDSVTVLVTSRPEEPLVREAQLEDPEPVLDEIAALTPTHAANHWKATLEAVAGYLDSSAFPLREVTLVTDLRRQGWDADVAEVLDDWAGRDVTLRIVDTGAEARGNVVLASFVQDTPVALVDTKVAFSAVVRNDGDQPAPAPEAVLTVDGNARSLVLPEVPPAGKIEVPLSVTFDSAGQHTVELALPGDPLPEDNVRFLAVDVRRTMDVVLVDGEPSARPFDSETDFLALAFSVGRAPWRVVRMEDTEWLETPMTAPDVLVLANVGTLPERRVRELEAMVAAGMGLLIFPGEQVDPAAYNEALFREGEGLLPGRMESVRDRDVTGLAVEPIADSPLAVLGKISADSLAKIRPKRLVHVSLPEGAGRQVRVLARWNDPQQSPAIVEKRFGAGRVVMVTVTADRAWSDWPIEPSYVLAMRQAATAVAAPGSQADNVTAGQPWRLPLDPEAIPAEGKLSGPDEGPAVTVPVQTEGPDAPCLKVGGTARAGLYQMSWEDPVRGARSHRFTASPDVRESDLARLPREQLERLLGKLEWEVVPFSEESLRLEGQATELWPALVLALLVLVVLESPLAAWVGRER